MDENDRFKELDSRIPSGEWSGFYLEAKDGLSHRGWMHLYLSFGEGVIRGEGTDYVGPWVIFGNYDLNSRRVSWIKRYLRKHTVNYEGTIIDQGIVGKWNIHHWNEGPFHIWPKNLFELESLYLSEDLSGQAPTILAGTVPVSPNNAA